MRDFRRAATTGRAIALALAALGASGSAHAAGELKLVPELPLLLVNFAVLLVLIYPVNRLLLQPLLAVLVERERRSDGALERAATLQAEATEAGAEVVRRTEDARAAAQRRRVEILGEGETQQRALLAAAREEAEREVEAVRRSVGDELEGARQSLHGDARALAREAATRILGRGLE